MRRQLSFVLGLSGAFELRLEEAMDGTILIVAQLNGIQGSSFESTYVSSIGGSAISYFGGMAGTTAADRRGSRSVWPWRTSRSTNDVERAASNLQQNLAASLRLPRRLVESWWKP